MQDFKHEHEEEHYGDEFESAKAHLHLAPTHKHRTHTREVVVHPVDYTHTDYDLGHREPVHAPVHHDTFYVQHPTPIYEDHHEALTPSGEEWVEVHRTPEHYVRHHDVPVLHDVLYPATHHKVVQPHKEPVKKVDGHAVAYHKKPVVVDHTVHHDYHVPVVHHDVPVVHHEVPVVHHEEPVVYESYQDTHAVPVYHEEPVVKEVHEYDTHYVPHYEPQPHVYEQARYVEAEPVVPYTTYSDHYGDLGHYDFPVVSRHQEQYAPSWVTHPELNHKYDDQHDIEPVPYHEHAILHSVDIPDHHSYQPKVTSHDFKPIHYSDYTER